MKRLVPGNAHRSDQRRGALVRSLIAALLLLSIVPSSTAGPWRSSESNTRGWQVMTPEERIKHQALVRSFADYHDCEVYRKRHHELMAERARQRGLLLLDAGKDFCDGLSRQQRTGASTD